MVPVNQGEGNTLPEALIWGFQLSLRSLSPIWKTWLWWPSQNGVPGHLGPPGNSLEPGS